MIFEVNLITGSCSNLFTNKYFCCFLTFIQNQIIHKDFHVDYDPLKDMLLIISLIKLSTADPESRGHSRTAWLYIDVKLLPKFHCSLDS